MSIKDTRLKLKSLRSLKYVLPSLSVNLYHRRLVGALTIFFKVFHQVQHPLNSRLPPSFIPQRLTRRALTLNSCALTSLRCSNQFSRCFIPSLIEIWNSLPENVVNAESINVFKKEVNILLWLCFIYIYFWYFCICVNILAFCFFLIVFV